MPKISFVPDNKAEIVESFPRLKLKVGEVARIIYLEDPDYAYTHTLKAPELDDDNKPIMKWVESRKTKEMVEVNSMEWLGRFICLGTEDKIKQRGVDVDNCPVCALASKDKNFPKPERRFAMHIAKYATKNLATAEVATPFSVQIQVWGFTENIFNQLSDFIYQDGWDPLSDYDIKLGPCEAPEMFQKFKINVLKIAEYKQSTEREQHVIDAFQANQDSNILNACGRKVDHAFLTDEINTVKEKWAIANGEKLADKDAEAKANLNNILGGKKPAESVKATPVTSEVETTNDSEPVADSPAPKATRAKAQPAPEPEPQKVADDTDKENIPKPTAVSFEDLVAGI